MFPLIGVTSNQVPPREDKTAQHSVADAYIQAVAQAGGIPVIIPAGISDGMLAALFDRLDGLLLTGGGDINPDRFGGLPHPRVYDIDELRDDLEIGLARMAAERGKPFLGICRGIQVINVALGGTLYTDIADQLSSALKHDCFPGYPRDHAAHTVAVDRDSLLSRVLGGESFAVNSLHHQGLDSIAASLKAIAWASDGLVEAVELPGHPFGIGVQWHPECLQAHASQRALFKAFVQASSSL